MTQTIGNLTEPELVEMIKKMDDIEQGEHALSTGFHVPVPGEGTAQVRNQQLIIQDPEGNGPLPVIRPVEPVQLFVNDQKVSAETPVSSTDRLVWRIADKPLFAIRVTEDRMAVFLHIRAKERFAWRLEEGEPSSVLELRAEEDRTTVLDRLHYAQIIEELERIGVAVKLDMSTIMKEVKQPSGREILVAEGKQAVPGRDARLELYFPEQITHEFYEAGGTVDFRNHYRIPSVRKGQLIAKKMPLSRGEAGYDVFGESIVPKPPKDLIVVTKQNVQMKDNGEIYALTDGRPRLTGTRIKTLDISTTHIEYGDVDIETGHIVFSGDVVIYGDVNDNMIVESLGNVYIYGSVFHATITATGSIYVRGNVIGSKLYSGYFGVLFNRLYQTAGRLSEQIGQLTAASRTLSVALKKQGRTARPGQLALLLMENKYTDIPAEIREMLSTLSHISHMHHDVFPKIRDKASVFLDPHQLLETASMNFLLGFQMLLGEVCRELEQMQEVKARTAISQCQSSELKSNGDIVIMRDGVILGDLYASGDIIFEKSGAVCRGSMLEAKQAIHAKIVGAQTGTSAFLKAGKKVVVHKMLMGKVSVGRSTLLIEEAVENISFTERSIQQFLADKRKRRSS